MFGSENATFRPYEHRTRAPLVLAGHPGGRRYDNHRSPKYPGPNPGYRVGWSSSVFAHRAESAERLSAHCAATVTFLHPDPLELFASTRSTAQSSPGANAQRSVRVAEALTSPPVRNARVADALGDAAAAEEALAVIAGPPPPPLMSGGGAEGPPVPIELEDIIAAPGKKAPGGDFWVTRKWRLAEATRRSPRASSGKSDGAAEAEASAPGYDLAPA